jgi:rubrerythrin
MEDPNVTTSSVINFVEKLEDYSSKFYEQLAKVYTEDKEIFLAFSKESKKNKALVTRTYQETITDALEACFAFKGLNLNNYTVNTTLAEDTSYSDALKMAIELEEKAGKFYLDTAERSKSLLATIPRIFRKVAEIRSNRKLKLKSVLESSL